MAIRIEAALRPVFVSDLDTWLLRLSEADYFQLSDAMRSVAIFGATGSGKTSGSGRALASAYLRAGMAGLVLCAKPDEVELWQHYARENGRERDLLLFGEGSSHAFNFIQYEIGAQGLRGIGSVTECIMRILEAERVVMPNVGGASDPFWERTPRQLLNNSLPMLYAAWGKLGIADIYRFIATAPKSRQELESAEWQRRSFMFETWVKASDSPVNPLDPADADMIGSFWRDEYAELDARQRGSVVINLSSALDRFLRGRLRDHFCAETSFTPEECFRDGRIVVMAMPSLSWNEDGLIGQHVFKYMWQRAVLRRATQPLEYRQRPLFTWADEAQYFVSAKDAEYQAACRSSLAGTVYLTQSMPSLLASLGGGPQAKALVDQLLGNFATKIFHSNADPETNDWAARTIGRVLTVRGNFSQGTSANRNKGLSRTTGTSTGMSHGTGSSQGREFTISSNRGSTKGTNQGHTNTIGTASSESASEGGSEVMDFAVEPGVFAQELRTGGNANGGRVDGVLFQTGRKFALTRGAWLPVSFRQ